MRQGRQRPEHAMQAKTAVSVPDVDFSHPDPAPKYAVMSRREFTPKVPVRWPQLASRRGHKGRICANSLYFSLIPGKRGHETGSQMAASSGGESSANSGLNTI